MAFLIDGIQTFAHNYLPTPLTWGLSKVARGTHIVAVEGFTNFWHVLPSAVSWYIKSYVTHELTMDSFEDVVDKVKTQAYLYLHGPLKIKEGELCAPLLLIHGDYSHPFTMLHLAEAAKKNLNIPVFSLQLPLIQDDERFEANARLIDLALDKIQTLVQDKKGNFDGVLGVGHSKGAIMLAEREFADNSSGKIKKTCTIAGPLNQKKDEDLDRLDFILQKIHQDICNHPDRKLMQIIPDDDWNASYAVMAARPEEECYTVPGMHLSGLYTQDTTDLVMEFCKAK